LINKKKRTSKEVLFVFVKIFDHNHYKSCRACYQKVKKHRNKKRAQLFRGALKPL